MAKVNAERHAEHIKTRINQRLLFWIREKEEQLVQEREKQPKSKEEIQDKAITLIILESSIASFKHVINEVKEIKL